ncbi:MAG: hypothetical protein ACKV2V_04875 [Blastocatellia bacterium]
MPETASFLFEAGAADITLTPPLTPPDVAMALLGNLPFTDEAFIDEAITLGSIKAAASRDIKLDQVKFSAGGGAFAGLGVYRSPQKLFADLRTEGMDETLDEWLDLPDLRDKNLYAMRWGYQAQAGVKGTVALGSAISFGASGQTEGLYAVLAVMDRDRPALDAIRDISENWKMPRQINTPAQLAPGSWVLAETDGALQLSLGVTYGYSYSWVREALTLGALNGDLGMKIETGVSAQLGFNASGRFVVVVGRENEKNALRVQVFRMRQHGWSFAFDASVTAQAKQSLLPKNFDDFIRGVFNVHGHQVLGDLLNELKKWTNSNKKLRDLLGKELVDYAWDMTREITGFDPETEIDKAIDRLQSALTKWQEMPHELNSALYDMLRRKTPLDELRGFLQKVTVLSDPIQLSGLLAEKLSEVAFFETPAGIWLSAMAQGGVLTLLTNVGVITAAGKNETIKHLQDIAGKTLGLLDGGTVEDTFRKLQTWIEDKLGLDRIIEAADKASFDKLDAWLKKRLTDFLGHTPVVEDLEKIRAAIKHLQGKAEEFYAKGLAALTEKYRAELHYSFNKTTTRTAMLDATFDFDADAASAGKYLRQAIDGNFAEILANPLPGVRLHQGALTHAIKRRTHIEVSLPYFKAALDHINESVAKGNIVDTADGRLWAFNLEATDEVRDHVLFRKAGMSKLTVAMQFSRKPGVREFSAGESRFDYSLRLAKKRASREYLEDKLELLAGQYLASEFAGGGNRSFSTYLTALDKALDDKGVGGDNFFGNMLIRLDVSLPGQVVLAWKKAPADKKDPVYMVMSRRIQNVMRRLIPLCYLQDPGQYQQTAVVYPLLAYSALPPINKVKLNGAGQLRFTEDAVYSWDYRDADLRTQVLEHYAGPKLRDDILPRIRRQMHESAADIADYQDAAIGRILSLKPAMSRDHFLSLLFSETELISKIHKTALKLREHMDAREPEEAVAALAEFGASLTNTFNQKAGATIYGGKTMRALGSMLFLEVARILDPELTDRITPTAMLDLVVLKDQPAFDMDKFLDGVQPPSSGIVLQQRIVSLPTN